MHHSGPLPDHRSMTGEAAGSDRKAPSKPGTTAQGPAVEPVPAEGRQAPGPVPAGDSPAAAIGRRTLSTAFVMIGPDRHLTVGMHDGSTVALRDVVMRKTDYCGVRVLGTSVGRKYCGSYADVATARPGGTPVPGNGDTPGADATGMEAKPFDPR